MKKIIRLTERDLTRIVKRIINENELDEIQKSTWDKISQNVKDKGYDDFSFRIKKHSMQFGTGDEKTIFNFTTERGTEISGELDDLPKNRISSKDMYTDSIWLKLDQYNEYGEYEDTKILECYVIYPKEGNEIKLNLFIAKNDIAIKASDKKTAINLINYLNEQGIKIPERFKIDWRSFTKGY